MRNTRLAHIIGAMLAIPAAFTVATAQDTRPGRDTDANRTMPASSAEDRTNENISGAKFADKAAIISKAEIELGQLAMEKSDNAAVQKFAKRMVNDHTKASAKLKSVAQQENIKLPDSLDARHREVKQKLSSLQGDAFDREYMNTMAKGHDEAVALFQSATQSPQVGSELKQYAANTLPTLREHRQLAHSLENETGHQTDRTATDR